MYFATVLRYRVINFSCRKGTDNAIVSTNRDQCKANVSAVIDNGAINSVGKSKCCLVYNCTRNTNTHSLILCLFICANPWYIHVYMLGDNTYARARSLSRSLSSSVCLSICLSVSLFVYVPVPARPPGFNILHSSSPGRPNSTTVQRVTTPTPGNCQWLYWDSLRQMISPSQPKGRCVTLHTPGQSSP